MASSLETGFGVRIERAGNGWLVVIHDGQGAAVSQRACGDGVEARTYASTVRQHISWLSEEKFREYYRIGA